MRLSDVCFVIGSWDGEIRLWKLDPKLRSFSLMGTIPAMGIVNSLQFVSPPKEFFQKAADPTKEGRVLLVAGLGREHRLGRWLNVGEGWNRALVVALSPH